MSVTWRIRSQMEEIDVGKRYAGHPTIFSMRMHHGGEFTKFPRREYIKGKQSYVDLVDIDTFSIHDIDEMMEELGYASEGNALYYHFQRPFGDLDFGLFALGSDDDVRHLGTFVCKHKIIDVYIEHGKTNLHTYTMPPNQSGVRITECSEPPSCSRRLFLNWHNTPAVELNNDHDKNLRTPVVELNNDLGNPPIDQSNTEMDNGNISDREGSYDGDESEDSDYYVDEDNIVDDVHVDMKDFEMNIDKDVEWVGGSSDNVLDQGTHHEDIEVINTEVLESGSSEDEGMESQRRKSIRAIQKAHANEEAIVSDSFYIFQTFSSAKEFKEKVKIHAIETRRELELQKNDKNRVRFKCKGKIPLLGDFGPSQQIVNDEEEDCPWVLYASKWKNDDDWMIKTYNKQHKCLQTREVKACTYKFLGDQIRDQVESNPQIPVRALQEQLQRKYQVGISKMKAYRARSQAVKHVTGDYASQFTVLRDYILELQTRNPDTTVKLDVESESNPDCQTRTFRRIYICLGALKKGFAAGRRDFLGLDGAFMKGSYPRQVLTAVGLDSNNGIYPLAYVVVEAESTSSWTWFLTYLGEDLGLGSNSNFTFVSDRQKGVIPAVARLFPCAEHRFCLRHIRENMKLRWRGKPFKDILWKCATATHVQQFTQAMEELKTLNKDCYEWLKKIPPHQWSRSHFSGRSHCDALLNNLCETFNGKIVDGRDKPIITCLEYIREYLMKKIVIVENAIEKAPGPLTPTAMSTLEKIKTEALEYRSIFCGNGRYQVSGHWMDQCIVDVRQGTCSCRKWELTGIPCKHAVATIWEMRKNSRDVGIPETWVHQAYWLQTWKEMYSFKIEPINGRRMWEKAVCPTTLLPPLHHVPIGRPKKKRRKSALENDDMVKGNRVSRAQKSVTCSKCSNSGHNARTCKGQKSRAGETVGRNG